MAPGSNKRKRPERSEDLSNRPSPHRPENLGLAQQNQQHGGSRGGRGGRGGGARRQSRQGAPSATPAADSAQVNSGNTGSPAPPLRRETPTVDSSRAATPSQTMPTSQPPADETSASPPAPYFYDHITEDRVQVWEAEGKSAALSLLTHGDDMEVSTTLQELLRSALDKRLDAQEAGLVIKQAISDRPPSESLDVQSLFLNTLALLDDTDTKNSNLLSLVVATNIDPEIIRQELDIPLLQALTLVRSSFTQMRTRKTTNILYRQANFNLLREETEGYAKLITEYFNTATRAVHNHDVSAESAFERITALVGSFDLDVGRVLDITLDISANLLVRAYDFFVKFYRCSFWWPEGGQLDNVRWEHQGFGAFPKWALPEAERPKLDPADEEERKKAEKEEIELLKLSRDVEFWKRLADENIGMDAFFELGQRKIVDYNEVLPLLETEISPEFDSRGKEINADRRKRINENRKFMKETGMLPPPGNSDAAQLLGFKLRFYASNARDSQDVLPENLIYLAALLIKIGFISLRDLYPHLYPADDKMLQEKERLRKEKAEKEAKERPGGGENALTQSKALTDDAPVPAARLALVKDRSGGTTPKPDKKEDDVKEELPTPLNQKILLLKALLVIGALPEALYILGRFPWLVDADTSIPPYLHRIALKMLSKVAETVQPIGDHDISTARPELKETAVNADGSVRFKERAAKKPTKWLGLDRVDKTDGHTYRHYYPDWDDNIPVCQDIEDVVLLCKTFLGFLGVKIGQDAELLGTLVRIAKRSLTLDLSNQNQARWLDLMKKLIVPALSLSQHNPGLTQEMYSLLEFFPTATRYNIYAGWFLGFAKRSDMAPAFAHNRAEVKEILRRVTNDTAKLHARALAKVAYSSPGIVVLDTIQLLETYSNMIPALIECTRYFSKMGYDVLTWGLIQSLGGSGKSRMQADGMLTSPWLQALAQYIASLFHRYNEVDPSPVLQYLASELRAGNTTDLEVFEQVLAEMGGIRSDLEFNDAQVLTMAGGEYLQTQTLSQLADKRFSRKLHAQRLIKALADPGLIGQILIAIAQERQMYPYQASSTTMPLKVLGNNLDKVQQVFAQYLDVLRTNMKPEDFETAVPDVFSLIGDFGIGPGTAFTICRGTILHRMREHDTAMKQESQAKKQETDDDVDMEGDATKPLTNGHHSEGEIEAVTSVSTEPDAAVAASPPGTSKGNAVPKSPPWHPILEPIMEQLPNVSPGLAEKVSIPFYTLFWTYSLQEIFNVLDVYKNEFEKVTEQLKSINKDRVDMSTVAVKERERKKKALLDLNDNLRTEMSVQAAIFFPVKRRLTAEKTHFFTSVDGKSNIDDMHLHLLEQCFLPRALLSSLDALYSFTMLKVLHDNGTPGFSTVNLLDRLMNKQKLAAVIFQCTAMEAQHLGRFLCEILKLLQSWHSSKETYEKEAHGASKQLLGFQKSTSKEPIDFENFRRLLYNWHSYLNGALQMCFESGEYMHIRNGITVLRAIVPVFPILNFMGHNMVKHVTAISDKETKRQDLKLAAMSLLGPLKNREKQWMMPQAFRINDASKQPGKPGSRAPSANPEMPQASADTPKLSATAPEFKPGPVALRNGTRKESMIGVEDGEIEDEKQVAGKGGDDVMTDAPAVTAKSEASQDIAVKDEAKAKENDKAALNSIKKAENVGSRPSTPATVPSKPVPADSSRGASTPQAASSIQGHTLPSRPDSKPPNRPLPTPPVDRQSGRYPGRADDKYGRLDRPGDNRPASRDHSPGGRARPRTPERDPRDPYYQSFAAARGGPPRDDRGTIRSVGPQDSRYSRDDPYISSRRDHPREHGPPQRPPYESRERTNGPMGLPPVQAAHPDRSVYPGAVAQQSSRAIPSAAQTSQSQDASHVNPDRLALINEDTAPGRARGRDLIGPPKETKRDRDTREGQGTPNSRTSEVRGAAVEPSRDSQARNPPASAAEIAPTGPRRGRQSRDLSVQGPTESSFGRLNGPAQEVPSGPRPPPPNGPAGRNTRGFPPTQAAPALSRSNESPLPSPSTSRPPESPAAPRGPALRATNDRRGSEQQFDRQSSSTSVPTTPASENGPAVHPSRLGQVGAQPPPIQTNLATNGAGVAASPTSAPPSGPRGPARAPLGPATGPPAAPPSGPASAVERQRRNDKQRADINATLQGATAPAPAAQGTSFRGAARQSNGPPVQALASPMEPPARRNEPNVARQEPATNVTAPRGDLFQGKPERNDEGGRRREDGRADRSARGSRNASRERRPDDERGPRPQGQPMEDRRDRRGGMRDERREREGYEAQPVRDTRAGERPFGPGDGPSRRAPAQEAAAPYPAQSLEWERDRRGARRDVPDDRTRGGRGGGRPEEFRGARREDELRMLPGDGPAQMAGRKRRHDDGPPAFDEPKRRRSGR